MIRSTFRSLLPNSIVARTTLSIIGLALLVGFVFAGASAWMLQRHEERRLTTGLEELLSVVEQAVSIACFVRDEALAREIVDGLLLNHAVAGARISTDGDTLFERNVTTGDALARADTLSIKRTIYSPFNTSEAVGQIELHASKAVIRADAREYTRYLLLVLGLEVALVALAVAWVVYNLITRPIKGISDELHHLELRTGMQLHTPPRNREDEIGRLVGDVNALITRLSDLIDTERRLRLEREAGERRLALIFEKVDAGIFTVDRSGLLQTWNPAFANLLGQPAPQQSLQTLLPIHAARVQALIDDSLASGTLREADLELTANGGGSQWIEIVLTPLDDGSLQGLINDISHRKHSELSAQRLASRDTLTGLLNRRGFDSELQPMLARRRRESDPLLALLMIDLDRFKQANDTHGHAVGDEVLRCVAAIIQRAVRRTDLVARLGGDEFTVALVSIDSVADAEQIARTIIDGIGKPMDLDNGITVQIGASIGVALVAESETSAVPALARADQAMYLVKQSGRGRARVAPLPA